MLNEVHATNHNSRQAFSMFFIIITVSSSVYICMYVYKFYTAKKQLRIEIQLMHFKSVKRLSYIFFNV